MATDYFVAMLFFPMLICVGILIALSLIGKPASTKEKAFLGLGRVRIARGFLGALFATLVYAVIAAAKIGLDKVSRSEITNAELVQLYPGYTLYILILTAPFVIAALIVIGFPFLAVLRKFELMTLPWIALIAVVLSIANGVFAIARPYNLWCTSHLAYCGASSAFTAILIALPAALGFALAAKIPLTR